MQNKKELEFSIAVNRLRLLAPDLARTPVGERQTRLQSEIKSLLRGKEADDRKAFLESLQEAFPYWPPDIEPPPPPPPPTEQEMINKLAQIARGSEDNRRRIFNMLRSAGLNTGFTDQQTSELRRIFNLPANAQPELNRVLELMLGLADTLVKLDDLTRRLFNEFGQTADLNGTPRLLEQLKLYIPLGDQEQSRFARKAVVDQVRTAIVRRVATLRIGFAEFQSSMASRFAPQLVQGAVRKTILGWKDAIWEEYIRRWGGADRTVVEAQLRAFMTQAIADAAGKIESENNSPD